MKHIVVYHSRCLDGIFSAAAVYKHLEALNCKDIVCIPQTYKDGFDLQFLDKDTTLWIVDFSFPYEILKDMDNLCAKVVWYDHHISSESIALMGDSLPNTEIHIDIKHSAAYTVWIRLFKTQPLKAITLSEDRDLWRFKFPETRSFTEGLFSHHDISPTSDKIRDLLTSDKTVNTYILEGDVLLRAKDNRIDRAINRGYYGKIKGHNAFFVNSGEDISEIGEKVYLSHEEPIVAVVYNIGENVVKFSLRSNTINVEQIARAFHGGGHVGAAGFELKLRMREVEKMLR
ncbi:MAG: hypothetical protein D4S01_08780 [Dehalococcoidia bacterium]|nr:MAG: hypothetical protein D4S01_08780 [Dehalococcoidia bacterium]